MIDEASDSFVCLFVVVAAAAASAVTFVLRWFVCVVASDESRALWLVDCWLLGASDEAWLVG